MSRTYSKSLYFAIDQWIKVRDAKGNLKGIGIILLFFILLRVTEIHNL